MAKDDWITTKEAAEISGYHVDYIRKLIKRKEIEARKFGRDWQVNQSNLLAYVRKVEKKGAKRGPKPGA
jgi:excisionase family DNA binding protein